MTSDAATTVIADSEAGTFCLPGCPELPEADCGLRSYPRARDALEWGFRPCASCRPMDVSRDGPTGALMDEIAGDPEFRKTAAGLMDAGIDPDRLRRRYRERFDITFQDYLRMRRINLRFGVPRRGEAGTGDGDVVFTRLGTPLGPMLAAATAGGLCLLEFAERRMMETQVKRLEKYHAGRFLMGYRPIFDSVGRELEEFFRGERKEFGIPLDLRGTPFRIRVWEELRRIPCGEVRSYAEQAATLGDPKAVRAVAGANGDNPVAILVPCHRVVGSDGSPVGYGGRIWRKEALLRLESGQGELEL